MCTSVATNIGKKGVPKIQTTEVTELAVTREGVGASCVIIGAEP